MCAPIRDRMSGRMTTLPTLVSVLNVRDGSKARTDVIVGVIIDHLLDPSMGEERVQRHEEEVPEAAGPTHLGRAAAWCRIEREMVNVVDETAPSWICAFARCVLR